MQASLVVTGRMVGAADLPPPTPRRALTVGMRYHTYGVPSRHNRTYENARAARRTRLRARPEWLGVTEDTPYRLG